MAVGLILIEPFADVDANVPGVMVIPAAPTASQLSVLLVPEFMLVGFAVKEMMVGKEPFPETEFDELIEPQPASPAQTNRAIMNASAQRCSSEKLVPRKPRTFRQNEVAESMLILSKLSLFPASA